MRILLLNHNLRGRGTWFRAWQFARELAARGHAVTLWTAAPHHYYRPARGTADSVEIVETPSWSPLVHGDDGWGPLDCAYRVGCALFARCELCYAFAHPPNVSWPAWVLARLRGKPLLYDWCDLYEDGVFARREALRAAGMSAPDPPLQRWAERREVAMERAMPRRAGRVTVISRLLERRARELGADPAHVLHLPNGADLDTIWPLAGAECRRELELPQARYVGYIANYHPDQELLLRGLRKAVDTGADVRLLATGPPFDAGLVRELELGARIVALGRVPLERLRVVLGAAEALLLPLAENRFNRSRVPHKFTQYLAAGRPILACAVGDIAERFGPPGEPCTIGLASAPDPAAFGAGLARLLDDDLDRVAMGRAARVLAEGELSWPRQADRLSAFLTQWLGAID